MIILSIETSCDETAVAIVEFKRGNAKVLANIVSSQVKMHSKFGGVVPSLASRMHLKNIIPVLQRSLANAKISKNKIDYIAITNGPGLIPALMVGTGAAKTLAYGLQKPLIGIHHIEGHIYANWLKESIKSKVHKVHKVKNYFKLWKVEFPIICLTVSGGHTQIILMKKDLNYKVIGETLDDAVGEAFDKIAKLLKLGYPGGPIIEKMAKKGDEEKIKFPRPMIDSNDYNFSFSGLKTAVLYEVNSRKKIDSRYKQDVAASFQKAAFDVLIFKTIKAAQKYKAKNIVLGGGVSANKKLQRSLKKAIRSNLPFCGFSFPLSKLTTDNALMIAIAAYKHIKADKGIKDWKSIKADANLRL
ncbi:MAG: tRNA (adenosine(37)-N6)-threonylcarbamoyltransferase complex transferase subunit TsaD [Candidatus Pacebacteria bacterium]|nr:tRNA (adenosine(37)-N6)-threonylcarbamoyltransferase complex transferase subunit TsaD [Candidatus Paceibacterota bacterium]